jgi:hypothetical protein
MDQQTASVLALGLIALVAIGFFAVFRQRGSAKVRGPFGTELTVDGSNDPSPAVRVENAKSAAGGLVAEDRTGRGSHITGVEVYGEIRASSAQPEADRDPKA